MCIDWTIVRSIDFSVIHAGGDAPIYGVRGGRLRRGCRRLQWAELNSAEFPASTTLC
jgi:hypothetical protein